MLLRKRKFVSLNSLRAQRQLMNVLRGMFRFGQFLTHALIIIDRQL